MKFNNEEIKKRYLEDSKYVNSPICILSYQLRQELNESQIVILKELMNACYLKGLKDADDCLHTNKEIDLTPEKSPI
jgi:hypothetical protein